MKVLIVHNFYKVRAGEFSVLKNETFENAEKWRRASKFYRELIELDPENPDHYKGMSRVLIKQGDMDGATKYFEKAKQFGG